MAKLEEVIVTARRVEESLQDVSVSVSNFSGADLERNVVLDVKDLPNVTPSLYIGTSTGQANNPVVSIRGQVQNDSTVLTVDPSVGIYLDEVYLGRTPGTILDMFDIASVQVLKGPQGTLFGRNTTGGAILITPKKADPAGEWEGFARAGAGNYGQQTLEGAMNFPVLDSLAFRIAYSRRERDGYGTRLLYSREDPEQLLDEQDVGDKDSVTWRGHMLWNATETFDLEFGVDSNDYNSNAVPIYDPTGDRAIIDDAGQVSGYERSSDDFYTFASEQPSENEADLKGWYLKAYYELPWFSVKLIHARRELDYFFRLDSDGVNVQVARLITEQSVEQSSTELHFLGALFDERLEYIVGLYDFEEDGHDNSNTFVSELAAAALGVPAPPAFPPGSTPLVDRTADADVFNESQSAFLHLSYNLLSSLTLSGGVRRVKDTKGMDISSFDPGLLNQAIGPRSEDPLHLSTTENCIYFPDAEGATNDGESCRLQREEEYYFTLYSAGLEWRPREDILLYLRSSRGARSGGQNFRGFDEQTLKPFDPEFVDDIEFGAKTEFLDRRLRINTALFMGDYEEFQFSEVVVPVSVVFNLGNATFEGGELEITALATPNLQVNANASYLNLEYDDDSLEQIHTPLWKWSLGANYNWPLTWGVADISVTYSSTEKANLDIPKDMVDNNPLAQESYRLLSARVSLTIPDWGLEIAAFGNNLTDEEYRTNMLEQVFKPNPHEHGIIDVGRPRFYGVTLTKDFSI